MRRKIAILILRALAKIYPPVIGKPFIYVKAANPVILFERNSTWLWKLAVNVQQRVCWIEWYSTASFKGYPKQKSGNALSVEKELERAGYVQHSNFWQKGFVRCAPFVDRWEAWHAMTGNPCKIVCAPDDLFPTLKYMERI